MKKAFLFFIPLLLLSAICEGSPCTVKEIRRYQKIDPVLLNLQKWLSVMHDVARWEWNHNRVCLYDEYELRARKALVTMATERGLPEDFATDLACSMIQAGRIIHEDDFHLWECQQAGVFTAVPDLFDELHPYHVELTHELLDGLASVFPLPARAADVSQLSKRSCDVIPHQAWSAVLKPLLNYQPGDGL